MLPAVPPMAQDGIPAWAIVSSKRRAHILRVATLMRDWAEERTLSAQEAGRWETAALLHDALRSAPREVLESWTPGFDGPAELRHGPAAAAAAERHGTCHDPEILEAVRWHTVGSPEWGLLGRALYCADYLEPGRAFHPEIRATLAGRFAVEPEAVLREVATWRQHFAAEEAWEVPEETRRFWASLGL